MVYVGTKTKITGWEVKSDDERLTLIRNLVFESIKDPIVIWTARAIVSECASRDEKCEIEKIYYAVKEGPMPIPIDGGKEIVYVDGLRFVEDVLALDTYPTAGKILRWMAQGANGEDCDGHTILVASLLMAIGYLTGAGIVSQDGSNYVHIFPLVGIPKTNPQEWLPLDTTVAEAYPGWFPKRGSKYKVKAMKVYAFVDGKMKGRKVI